MNESKTASNDPTRRNFLRSSSLAVAGGLGGFQLAGTADARSRQNPDDKRDNGERVIYADEHGRIVKINSYSYVIREARSKEDYEYLREKLNEILMDSGDVSTQGHSDSGSDHEDGTYDGRSWAVDTEFWAQTEDGYAEMEGTADAAWWGEAYWHDEPLDVDISITSRLVASYEGDSHSVTVSVPPGYDYSISDNRIEARLSHSWEDENFPSLHHDKGAVTFDVGDGCYNWIRQDDRFKYAYEDGNVEYYGTAVKADVGHCWV
jgi:hypothetical protein